MGRVVIALNAPCLRDVEFCIDASAFVLGGRHLIREYACVGLVGDRGCAVLDDGAEFADVVARCRVGVFKVRRGTAPRPAAVVTTASHYRNPFANAVRNVAGGLDFKHAFHAVVVIHIPNLREIVQKVVFAAFDYFVEVFLGVGVFLVIEVGLGKQAHRRTLGGATEFAIIDGFATERQVFYRFEEVLLYLGVGLVQCGAGNILAVFHHHFEHQRNAAKILRQFKVRIGADKLGLRHHTVFLVFAYRRDSRHVLQHGVATVDALVTVLPEIGESAARGLALIENEVVVAVLALCGVVHPAVVGSHIGKDVGVVYLPPVVVSQGLIAAIHLSQTLFLVVEVIVENLRALDILRQEVLGAASKSHRRCHYAVFDNIFHRIYWF